MKQWVVLTVIFFISACNTEPKEINYGEDKCDFCTMNIMDKPYGTELVTSKGKVYKFDSSECMLNYMKDNNNEYAYILTNTMDNPGELKDATKAYFLISPNLPSPMGAGITAFSTKELADKAQLEYEGKVYEFEKLKEVFATMAKPHAH